MKNDAKCIASTSGQLALKLAKEIVRLKGGKKRVDLELLEKIRDALGTGQFEDA